MAVAPRKRLIDTVVVVGSLDNRWPTRPPSEMTMGPLEPPKVCASASSMFRLIVVSSMENPGRQGWRLLGHP